ncbi:MAG TPA: hypothetical protein PLP75_11690 [Burkholderiales bacterium]|nr:hypothetical protein [Burkholderiales bacterium]
MLRVIKNKIHLLYNKIMPMKSALYKGAFPELRQNMYSLSRSKLLTQSRKIRRISPYLVKEMTKCGLLPHYSHLANCGFRLVMLIERAHCSKNDWYFKNGDAFIIYRQVRGKSNKQFILRKRNTAAKVIDINFAGELLNSINAKSVLNHCYNLLMFKGNVVYCFKQINEIIAEHGYVFIGNGDNYAESLYHKGNVYIMLSPHGYFTLCLGKIPYCANCEHFHKQENSIMIEIGINYGSTLPEFIEIIKWLESLEFFIDL